MRPLGRDPAPDATAGGPYLPVKGTSRACMVRARRRTFRASGRRGSFGRRVGALNRWVVAAASVVVMAGLGSFNAWSVFRLPLSDLYGANVTDVNTAFFISSLVFGLVASGSALLVGREGPPAVGVAGRLLYVLVVSLSGLAGDSLRRPGAPGPLGRPARLLLPGALRDGRTDGAGAIAAASVGPPAAKRG